MSVNFSLEGKIAFVTGASYRHAPYYKVRPLYHTPPPGARRRFFQQDDESITSRAPVGAGFYPAQKQRNGGRCQKTPEETSGVFFAQTAQYIIQWR